MKYQILESCWKHSRIWTFELIDVLNLSNEKGKISDLNKSILVLFNAKDELITKKDRAQSDLEKINILVKPVRNFIASNKKLLNSTVVDLNRMSIMRIEPFDLFNCINDNNLTEWELNRNINFVKRNIENNWVAFNQSYGRMLIKLKINKYDIEW